MKLKQNSVLVLFLLILKEAGEGRDVIVESLGLACEWFSVNFPPSQSGGRVSTGKQTPRTLTRGAVGTHARCVHDSAQRLSHRLHLDFPVYMNAVQRMKLSKKTQLSTERY